MKTKMLVLGSLFTVGFFMMSCSQSGQQKDESASDQSTSEKVDISGFSPSLEKSKVLWSGTSLGVYTHTGTVDLTKADLEIKNNQIAGGSFTVDLTTMIATDENFNPEEGSTKEKLIGHLSSPDFFDVGNYPTATFVINSVEGNSAKGTLTVRGISHEETVENIEIIKHEGKVKITGDLVFDRKKYDVAWDYPSKDMLLKKELELEITLVGA